MNIHIEYLLNYLTDELGSIEDVKIRPEFVSSTKRSIDLPQDYDAKVNHLHHSEGVRVTIGSRDFFFSSRLVAEKKYSEIYAAASELKNRYS